MDSGEAPDRPWHRIRAEIDLPAATAWWVLTAHVLTILSPLLLIGYVAAHESELGQLLERPALLTASAVILIVASVVESAQNTLDRWYLTGVPPSLLDFVFTTLVGAALACQALAVYGDTSWMWPVMWGLVALLAAAYLLGRPVQPFQALLGVAGAGALYAATHDPIAWATLLTVFATVFFLSILLATRQQVMHGFTTLVNAASILFVIAALRGGITGETTSWLLLGAMAALVVGGLLALRPRLLRLGPTPRSHERLPAAVGGGVSA
jgi:hypothetical protein